MFCVFDFLSSGVFSISVLSLNFVFVFFSLDERVPGQSIDASSFQTRTSQNAKTEHLLQLARLSKLLRNRITLALMFLKFDQAPR